MLRLNLLYVYLDVCVWKLFVFHIIVAVVVLVGIGVAVVFAFVDFVTLEGGNDRLTGKRDNQILCATLLVFIELRLGATHQWHSSCSYLVLHRIFVVVAYVFMVMIVMLLLLYVVCVVYN